MNTNVILSIAVPTFNMERWLKKNLATYEDDRLKNRLEVICLNNASEDSSKEIIQEYVARTPEIFHLLDRDSRGYGSSINAAIDVARGKYFRIVDADDWVDTEELVKLVDTLAHCTTDVVVTDYEIVNMQDGSMIPVTTEQKNIPYNAEFHDLDACKAILPTIHSTTFRMEILRKSGFYMQDKIFFVDEEYTILPYLQVETSICYPFDVYRYQVANPGQSTSPQNRARLFRHREQVLKRLIPAYQKAKTDKVSKDRLDYCFIRIAKGVGDHFTTLYMYVEDRAEGRMLAREWQDYLCAQAPEFAQLVQKKAWLLSILNRMHVSRKGYDNLKRCLLPGRRL